jgi:hypothetical protein
MTDPHPEPACFQAGFMRRVHNRVMGPLLRTWLFAVLLALAGGTSVPAQDSATRADEDGSSQQVEESDEAFRRRMELEDARQRDAIYSTPVDTSPAGLEKLDKLPEGSRDNIRDQLVDVIMENGDWEPFDALRDYPYTPTEAAQKEPELMAQEQAAWDEQIEKYHEREAAAFGANRGPVPGPGNPTGEEGDGASASSGQGDRQGQGQQGGGAGSEGGGEAGSEAAGSSSAGTYQPYQSDHSRAEDEVSTAGVQQSALDFLRGQQQQAQSSPPAPAAQPARDPAQAPAEIDLSTPGIIAIEDLDRLEGIDLTADPEESEQP